MDERQAQYITDMLSNAFNQSIALVTELAKAFGAISFIAPKADRWVMRVNPKVYSQLLPMSRRKMQPYVRKAWRDARQP